MLFNLFSGQLTLINFSLIIAGLLTAISFHEFAHAWAAFKLGDPTAKIAGRLSLNPKSHLDPVGSLFLLFFGFGWGRPVPFNIFNLENPRRDTALISLAGPGANLFLASVFSIFIKLQLLPLMILLPIIVININLAVFNLVPVHPLDGFKVIWGVLPEKIADEWQKLSLYGLWILVLLMLLPGIGFISSVISPISQTLLELMLE